jgi:SSS family transporter
MSAVLDNLREFWMVHVLLLGYTVILAWHAWTGNRETKGLADYYVGGRSMGGAVVGISFFATYSSTNSFVGFSGQAYEWGVGWLLLIPGVVGFSFFAWVAVAPRLRAFTEALGSLTIPDFIGFRFGSQTARVLAALIVVFSSLLYMTAVYKGIGNLVEVFLEIPYKPAIGIVFLVVMLYTLIGGFISVVKTDAVQGIVMMFAAVLLSVGTVRAAGGLGSVLDVRDQPGGEALFQLDGVLPLPVLLGVVFAGVVKFVVEPRQLSRFYALESPQAARTGAVVSTLTFAGVYTLLVPIGLYARRIFPDGLTDTDLVVPELLALEGVFSAGVAAFLLVAMVAAAMSSLDSVLLVTASTFERDVVGVVRGARAEAAELRATRWFVALFAAITAVLALEPPGGIVSLTVLSGSLYGACFFPAVLLGLYWRKGTGAAAVASLAAGAAALILWRESSLSSVIHEVFPALLTSTLVYVLVSLRSAPYDDETVAALFRGGGEPVGAAAAPSVPPSGA